MTIPISPASAPRKDILKKRKSFYRSKGGIRRSYSENHLCYSTNQIRCDQSLSKPKLNNEEEKLNWVERLLQIRSLWKNKQVEENVDGADNIGDEVSDCNCGDEDVCAVNYDSEGEGREESFDSESFSKLLGQVSWSDTRLLSQLAFLCNLAYVIPEIEGKDLKKCYGLQFVTSSVEEKAEVEAIREKLNHDPTRVPVTDTTVRRSKHLELEKKRPIRSSVAYGIAASAASITR